MQDSAVPFVTSSLNLAAYLVLRRHRTLAEFVRPDGPGRVVFQFQGSAGLTADVADFSAQHVTIEPVAYENARTMLRCRMRDVTLPSTATVAGGGR
jgi:hypothetical protein